MHQRRANLRLLASALCALSFFSSASSASSATLEEIKKRGYMVVATEDNYPPFNFIENGKPVGLNNDLFALLKASAPFEVRQQILPFQGLLSGVITGEFDVALTSTTVTDQRAQQLTFTMPIAEATYYYVKRKGDVRIKSLKDLSELSVGTQLGSAMQQRLPEVDAKLKTLGAKLGRAVLYPSYPEAYQDLSVGRVDYVVNSVVALADLIRKRPNDFELGEAVDQSTYQSWAVKKGNKDVQEFLNRFLLEQRKNGNMANLQKKWLNTTFPNLPDTAMLPGDRPISE